MDTVGVSVRWIGFPMNNLAIWQLLSFIWKHYEITNIKDIHLRLIVYYWENKET